MNRVYYIFLLSLTILYTSELKCQEFEGKIVYKTYTTKSKNIPDTIFSDTLLNTIYNNTVFKDTDTNFLKTIYYIKKLKSKRLTYSNKEDAINSIYLCSDDPNIYFFYFENQNELCWKVNTEKINKTIISKKINTKDTIEVLGKKCSSITLKYSNMSIIKLYFSIDFKVDIEYKDKYCDDIFEYMYICKAIPLKIIEYGVMNNQEYIAIEIKKEKIKNKIYKVPEFNKVLEMDKSY